MKNYLIVLFLSAHISLYCASIIDTLNLETKIYQRVLVRDQEEFKRLKIIRLLMRPYKRDDDIESTAINKAFEETIKKNLKLVETEITKIKMLSLRELDSREKIAFYTMLAYKMRSYKVFSEKAVEIDKAMQGLMRKRQDLGIIWNTTDDYKYENILKKLLTLWGTFDTQLTCSDNNTPKIIKDALCTYLRYLLMNLEHKDHEKEKKDDLITYGVQKDFFKKDEILLGKKDHDNNYNFKFDPHYYSLMKKVPARRAAIESSNQQMCPIPCTIKQSFHSAFKNPYVSS